MTRTSQPPLARFEERILAELKEEVVARQPGLPPAKTRRPPRRIVMAAAIGVSASVAAGLAVATGTSPAGTRAPGYSLAADFLNRAAATARAQNTPLPKPDQAGYLEQLIVSPGPHGGIRECLVNWYPSPLTGLAVTIAGGRCGPGVPPVPSALKSFSPSPKAGYLYPALNTLPTSPAALRAALYAAAARGGAAWSMPSSASADQIVFSFISRLVQVPLSGSLRAALYEVIARIPGVILVRDAVDAAGRHGTGIVMKWDYPGYGMGTAEIIFAPRTYTVLGAGNVMPGQRVYFANLGSGLVTPPGS
jgi:hypothetical protein